MLCIPVERATNFSTGTGGADDKANASCLEKGTVILKMIPVEILGPFSTKKAFAFLDDGSTMTLVNKNIIRELQISGSKLKIKVQGTRDREPFPLNCERVSFRISGPAGDSEITGALVVSGLSFPGQTDSRNLVRLIATPGPIY